MITPLPGATPLVPGSCTLPFPGIAAAIVDETGNDVPNGQGRHPRREEALAEHDPHHLGRPRALQVELLPARAQGLLPGRRRRDPRRRDRLLHASPAASTTCSTSAATAWARWRSNRRWCRCTELVAEAAVVGRPDETTGEAICAFVVLKRARPTGDEAKKIANELRNWVAKEIGPIAKPKDIRFGDNLPKTRSGKIMRRLLRSIAKGEAITQDTSTLENPAILEQLARKELKENDMDNDLTARIAARPEVPGAEGQALALGLVADAGDDGRVLRLHPAGGLRQAVPGHAPGRRRDDHRHADRPGRHRLHDRHHRASTCGAPTASSTR